MIGTGDKGRRMKSVDKYRSFVMAILSEEDGGQHRIMIEIIIHVCGNNCLLLIFFSFMYNTICIHICISSLSGWFSDETSCI